MFPSGKLSIHSGEKKNVVKHQTSARQAVVNAAGVGPAPVTHPTGGGVPKDAERMRGPLSRAELWLPSEEAVHRDAGL